MAHKSVIEVAGQYEFFRTLNTSEVRTLLEVFASMDRHAFNGGNTHERLVLPINKFQTAFYKALDAVLLLPEQESRAFNENIREWVKATRHHVLKVTIPPHAHSIWVVYHGPVIALERRPVSGPHSRPAGQYDSAFRLI